MAKISIPELKWEQTNVEGNIILQLGEPAKEYDVKGFKDCGRFVEVLLPDSRLIRVCNPKTKAPEGKYVLRSKIQIKSQADLASATQLTWVVHPSEAWPDEPEKIVAEWKNSLRLIDDSIPNKGFRTPQLGAIHAIAAHWSVSSDPGIVVMPTGTGKTETMLATIIFHSCSKVLVVVPSDALRRQIFTKFSTLGCLKEIGCLDLDAPLPRVARIKSGIRKKSDARKILESANVLVATSAILNNCSDSAKEEIVGQCGYLFVDEAHHIPAPTWQRIQDSFIEKRILQFTATPFRNDGKRIKGKVIYNYPLGLAQDEDYFRNISLVPVDEMDEEKADLEIAKAAVKKLEEDLSSGFDHLVLARVRGIPRSARIHAIYEKVAKKFKPILIHSQSKLKERIENIGRLKSRESRILVCVDMFGEGFDLPNLKIAAMHDIHKSLPITLQFIGRFTRTSKEVGNASVVVNLDDPKAPKELQGLYAQDANWNSMIRRASEQKITDEISMQEFIDSFEGTLPNQIPLWNMRPGFSMLLYRIQSLECDFEQFAGCFSGVEDVWSAVSDSEDLAIAVIAKKEDVKWGKYQDIKNNMWHLVIAYIDRDLDLLYVYQSNYDVLSPDFIATSLCGEGAELVVGPQLFRIFSTIERPMIKNLGASKSGTISFTMYFGPEVSVGITSVEKAESELNNLLGWGYEAGEKITAGCSLKRGKLWSVDGGRIPDWVKWAKKTAKKVMDDQLPDSEVIKDFLRPVKCESRPPKVPIAIEWGEKILQYLEDRVSIFFGTSEVKLHEVDIRIEEYTATGDICFSICSASLKTVYELQIPNAATKDGYCYRRKSGRPVSIRVGSGLKTGFEERMVRDPIIIMYEDGSFSYNNYLVEAPCRGLISLDCIEAVDWGVTNKKKESQGKSRDSDSVQFQTIEMMKTDGFEVLFDDDASGEAADIIGIRRESDDRVTLALVHCKYSSSEESGARLKDLYEVCGQAQRSIKWKHRGIRELTEHMRKREKKWQDNGYSRFVKGTFATLKMLEKTARKTGLDMEVWIVQPGLSKRKVNEELRRLLGTTELYLKRTAEADLIVLTDK